MRHYLVRDVMTADPTTVTPAMPLKDVADILVRRRIGVVPVVTPQGRVAGVVTEADLLGKERLQRDPEVALDAPALPGPPGHRHRRDRGGAHGPPPGDGSGRRERGGGRPVDGPPPVPLSAGDR